MDIIEEKTEELLNVLVNPKDEYVPTCGGFCGVCGGCGD